jgi:hypothetical protein
MHTFHPEYLEGGDYLGDLGLDGRIILKRILKNRVLVCG